MLLISMGMEVPFSTPEFPMLAVELAVDRPLRCTDQRRAPDSDLVCGRP
jgi:hypothetical protein